MKGIVMKRFGRIALIAGLVSGAASVQAGELIFGPDARADFEGWRTTTGDTYIDFENPELSNGPLHTIMVGALEVTFKTTQKRYPQIEEVDWPGVLLPYNYVSTTQNGTHTLIGAGSSTGVPDGQARYEIVFSEPQARVGMMRLWNVNAITRFYNPDGILLAEHQNTASHEFVGWVAGGPNPAEWVSRVEMDGNIVQGTFQVGETDELFFGTEKPVDPIEPVYGPEALDLFVSLQDLLGDTLIDFNNLPAGPLSQIELPDGGALTFRTTEKRYPLPPVSVDLPVAVSSIDAASGTMEIMGASSTSGNRDGQHRYEIVFPEPQHRVGIKRNWNNNSLTRFYNRDGELLAEHQNVQFHEFVGWIGDPDEEATWVARLELDGLYAGSYQVGYSDDLRFGSNLPDRRSMRIRQITVSPSMEITVQWEPDQVNHAFEFSHDLVNWEIADGTLQADSWTGSLPGTEPLFFRVLTQKLFN